MLRNTLVLLMVSLFFGCAAPALLKEDQMSLDSPAFFAAFTGCAMKAGRTVRILEEKGDLTAKILQSRDWSLVSPQFCGGETPRLSYLGRVARYMEMLRPYSSFPNLLEGVEFALYTKEAGKVKQQILGADWEEVLIGQLSISI